MKEREIFAAATKNSDAPEQPPRLGLLPVSLVCALVLAPAVFATIRVAPLLEQSPVYAAAFAAVVGLCVFLVMAVLALSLQRREMVRRSGAFPAPPSAPSAPKIAASDASRDDRRARMASLIAEIRAHSRSATGAPEARAETATAITKRLAALSSDSAHCASRAAELLAGAEMGVAQAEQGARALAAAGGSATDSPDVIGEVARVVAQAAESIRALSRRSNEVVEIIDLVQTIATQTNLLSLGATVEAVRAGEDGAGFAAVANEIGALAGQSGRAADRVAAHVASVRQAIAGAAAAVADLERCIDRIEASSPDVSALIRLEGEKADALVADYKGADGGLRQDIGLRQGIEAIARLGSLAGDAGHSIAGLEERMADLVQTIHERTVVTGDAGEDRAT